MRVRMSSARRIAAGAAACLWPFAAAAQQVVCNYSYGGESSLLVARPVASPYGVPAVTVGSYFKFRVVFQKHPADLASINIYVYADRDEGAVPIHQASYRYPPPQDGGAPYGFTGLHFVYEPVRDGELQYWCRMQDDSGAAQ